MRGERETIEVQVLKGGSGSCKLALEARYLERLFQEGSEGRAGRSGRKRLGERLGGLGDHVDNDSAKEEKWKEKEGYVKR